MSAPKYYTLVGTGDKMPAIGLGTWKSATSDVGAAVYEALKCGYKLIDCAACYGNEKEVGTGLSRALSEGVISRADLFVTSKLWNTMHAAADVEPACRQTLSDLGLEYLDLYLIHWPCSRDPGQDPSTYVDIPFEETWKAMEGLVKKGLVKNIGVSNFTVKKLERLLASATITPAVNQVEFHPLLQQRGVAAFCKEHGIAITSYSTLGSNDSGLRKSAPNLLEVPTICNIAKKHGKSPAQVILRWALGKGVAVIPKTVRKERLAQNLASGSFDLDADDCSAMDALDAHVRTCDGSLFYGSLTPEEFWDNE